jgi:uncharacterized protein DUF3618
MSEKKAGANAGAVVDDLRDDLTHTRKDLGDTMSTLSEKADVKERVADTTHQVGESVRRRPGSWAAAAAGVLAGAAAIATLRWRKARQAPKSRAERAWHGVTKRVRKAAARVR